MAKQPAYKVVIQSCSILSALHGAAGDLTELLDEVESWRDNTPDSLQSTDKYQLISDAADSLSEASSLEGCTDSIEKSMVLLALGRAYVAPCPKHVIGTLCSSCGWDGVGVRSEGIMIWKNTEERSEVASHLGIVGRIGFINYTWIGEGSNIESKASYNAGQCFNSKAEAVAAFEEKVAEIYKKHPLVAKPGRSEVTYLAPLDGAEHLLEASCKYGESQPTRKGRGTSRAMRLSNAISLAQAGIDALRSELETLPKEKDENEHSEIITSIANELDEYERILGEFESVEFPGMFG